MRPTWLALALLIGFRAFAQDGGTMFEARPPAGPLDAVSVHKAVLDVLRPDGGIGPRIVVQGGVWLSDNYDIGFAGELADLRAQNDSLKKHAPDVPYQWIYGTALVAALVGFAAGWCSADPGHCGTAMR